MRGNGEGVKGTCWAPAPGVGGYWGPLILGSYHIVGVSDTGLASSYLRKLGADSPDLPPEGLGFTV